LLQKDGRIRVVYCSSEALAQGVLAEAMARGLRVPQDLAVCGFRDAELAAHLQPSLTSVHWTAAAASPSLRGSSTWASGSSSGHRAPHRRALIHCDVVTVGDRTPQANRPLSRY
jgi:hypothetical protein